MKTMARVLTKRQRAQVENDKARKKHEATLSLLKVELDSLYESLAQATEAWASARRLKEVLLGLKLEELDNTRGGDCFYDSTLQAGGAE